MAKLNYEMDVTFNPPNPAPGQWEEITVRISNATGEISAVYASVADYPFSASLRKSAEDTFSTRLMVPWEAEVGQYTVVVWGVSPSGDSGPRVSIPVVLKAS